MFLVELRVGLPIANDFYSSQFKWPNKNPSSYVKNVVSSVKCTLEGGLEGNLMGSPSHFRDRFNRAALFFHVESYKELIKQFPHCAKSMVRGGFGENFVVDHPDLSPSVVCIGDVYRIGTAEFTVTGPRHPCPKVDGWHRSEGVRQFAHEHGLGGYFVKVSKEGEFSTGDAITLVKRINPGFSIRRVCEGLFNKEKAEDTEEFYTALIGMDDLITVHYKSAAVSRLEDLRLRNKPLVSVENAMFLASRVSVVALFCLGVVFASRKV